MIDVQSLTKVYRNQKGIFDLNFSISEGEVFGYLGPNGAGKTTTIRNLMGFVNPDSGTCRIMGLNCRTQASQIHRCLGYLPGEMAFFESYTAIGYLKFMAEMKKVSDLKRMYDLIDRFELDTRGNIKKMSKGVKPKLGLVVAFMGDPLVYLLDEPASGLDPLMQNRFTELVLNEKKRGKTILMSSHMFEEVERTCDRVSIIRNGSLAMEGDIHVLGQNRSKAFLIQLTHPEDAARLTAFGAKVVRLSPDRFEVAIRGEQVGALLKLLAELEVVSLESKKESLEEIFLHLYGEEGADESHAI